MIRLLRNAHWNSDKISCRLRPHTSFTRPCYKLILLIHQRRSNSNVHRCVDCKSPKYLHKMLKIVNWKLKNEAEKTSSSLFFSFISQTLFNNAICRMLYNAKHSKRQQLKFRLVKEITTRGRNDKERNFWTETDAAACYFSLSFRRCLVRFSLSFFSVESVLCFSVRSLRFPKIFEDTAAEIKAHKVEFGEKNRAKVKFGEHTIKLKKSLTVIGWRSLISTTAALYRLIALEATRSCHRERERGEVCNWRKVKIWRESEFCTHNNFIIIFARRT